MNKLPKDKRDKILGVIAATCVLMAALWLLLLSKQRQAIKDVGVQIATSRGRVDKATLAIAATEKVESDLSKELNKLQTREGTMAAGDMYSWIIQTVNGFKSRYQVEIPQFSRETPVEAGIFANFPYKAAAFNVKGTAYFHDFGKFLASFEDTFPNMRVQNIELEPAPSLGSDDREKISFRMDLVTLIKPTVQ